MESEFSSISGVPLFHSALAIEAEAFLQPSGVGADEGWDEDLAGQNRLAAAYCVLEEFRLARKHYETLADQASRGGLPGLALAARGNAALVLALGTLGDGPDGREDLAEAYKLLFQLLEEARTLALPGLEARILSKLGLVAGLSGWIGESETWLRQAVQAEKELRRQALTAKARLFLAENLLAQDRLAEAEMEARLCYEYALSCSDEGLRSSASWVRGRVFEALSHWREAAQAYRECIDLGRASYRERTLLSNRDLRPEALPACLPSKAEELA